MKNLKAILNELILPFLVSWFFMTLLVDIVVIPTVFKNISNLEEGGRIGMIVFHRFNCIEIFFGVCILAGVLLREKKSKGLIGASMLLLFFSLLYTFYMTPTIARIGTSLHQVATTSSEYEFLRHEHTMFHNLYRYFDTTKLGILLLFSGVMIFLNSKHKERV